MKLKLLLVFLLIALPVSAYYDESSPIEWQDYGEAAFEQASQENKPVFMLITAVWCYWCHVYRDETLHSPEVSKYINDNYIPIFVDADKRQDLTRQYLAGGWPSTVIFSPQGKEVNRINGMIAKDDLLKHIKTVKTYFDDNVFFEEELESNNISRVVATNKKLQEFYDATPKKILANYDKEFGGFGADRKFPLGQIYEYFLLRYAKTKENILLEATQLSLNKMAPKNWIDYNLEVEDRVISGIYDPIEGGFFRYNLNQNWTKPHYEKMLTSNAYIIRAYLLAYKTTGNERFKQIAIKSLQYVQTNLQDKKTGRLFGSQDAGKEWYYLQTAKNRKDALYEGPPVIDNSTYADWSSPMISTFVLAADVLDDPQYEFSALQAANALKNLLVSDQGVLHYYDGKSTLNGLLLDNAQVASAFLDVYDLTQNKSWLDSAEQIIEFSNSRLYNKKIGVYYERNSTNFELYGRGDYFLEEYPSDGNTDMALALIKAHKSTSDPQYLTRARKVMGFLIANNALPSQLVKQARISEYLLENEVSLKIKREPIKANFILLVFLSFIAGLLSFLSPCTLPLLPAYAAHTIKAKKNSVRRTLAFFAGLALVFALLGISVALLGSVLLKAIPQLSMGAGLVIILFGVLTILGAGFSGFSRGRFKDGTFGCFVFGASYGVAWTPCVGPILGSIMILAATSSSWAGGGLLLLAYAAGISIPLLLLSLYIDRLRKGRAWRFLQGKPIQFKIFGRTIHTHTTNIVAGVLLILIGFLMFQGYLYAFNSFATDLPIQQQLFRLETWLLNLVG